MDLIFAALSVVVFIILFLVAKQLSRSKKVIKEYHQKYAGIIDVNAENENLKTEKRRMENEITDLRESYRQKRIIFDQLVNEAAIYDEEIQLADLGFYKPHFDFDTSEVYKEKLTEIKARQKEMISFKTAITCERAWTVDGSKTKGNALINRGIRLTARAFNNECDAAVSNVRWNNVERMEQRIQKAFTAINKLNESNAIIISGDYLELKIQELRLGYEYAEKKKKEKEEQAEIRQQMREELALEQEMQKAQKEEEKFEKLLEKARREVERATGAKLETLNKKISDLNSELETAHEKSERAKSMAQQTKNGHVYIISNIGSFGEDVFKIGMTRRLEPLDRVKELGDASVPFIFDVHAMIHSDDAPALEKSLHKTFGENRLNKVNTRKEFFRVTLKEIQQETLKIEPDAEFIETAEARDYRESKSIILQRMKSHEKQQEVNQYPEAI